MNTLVVVILQNIHNLYRGITMRTSLTHKFYKMVMKYCNLVMCIKLFHQVDILCSIATNPIIGSI